jgi:hypothetical protein
VPINWIAELSNPARYERQIDRLYSKYAGQRRMYTLTHQGLTFSELLPDRRRVGALLAREIRNGAYVPAAARVRNVMLDRPRDLFYLEGLDFILHGVAGDLLAEAIEPLLSPNLYSYRQGSSSWTAVRRFGAWIRKHRRAHPDPKTRGVYVFRGDVHSYADSVTLGARSPLWPMLRRVIGIEGDGPHWKLLEQLVRPEILHDDGSRSMRSYGLPLGSPLATPILNLYLHELDQKLDAFDGGFYGRFGDDLLFAHVDPDIVKKAMALIGDFLDRHELELHAEKQRLLFFNGAARRSAVWPETQGTYSVVFLGCEIRFDGTLALPNDKWRSVLTDLRARILRTMRLVRDAPLAEQGATLCAVANAALDPRSPFAHTHTMRLRSLVTSRDQLAELDYFIERTIAEALTRRRGPQAFRAIPRRRMREEWKLESLVRLRNGHRERTRHD